MMTMDHATKSLALSAVLLASMMAGCKKPNPPSEPSAPPPTPILWNGNANAYRAQIGATLAFSCPPGGSPSSVWGTDTYTSDSSICGAAAHSGRLQSAQGGVVQIQITPGQAAYQGTIRAGVGSLNYGPYPGSFTIVGGPTPGLIAVPIPSVNVNSNGVAIGGVQINVGSGGTSPWTQNAREHRGQNGTSFVHQCPPGGSFGSVWGSGPYTDDSSICTAAVHAGRIQLATGGPVTVFVHPGRASFNGTEANGVRTSNFATYPGTFSFDAVLPPEATAPAGSEAITWSATATQYRGQNGSNHRFWCPPGGSTSSVWGSGPYTDDSSICTAAVHAGRIQLATGGVVNARIAQGFARYQGSARNGVTSSNFGRFAGSLVIMP